MSADPVALISRKTGDWWKDERRHWCAYCGVAIHKPTAGVQNVTKATRDHVIPRVHKGRHVTIPSCEECNRRKGTAGLAEFMLSPYFSDIRGRTTATKWSMTDLWLVLALAAVEQARAHAASWPVAKPAAPKTPKPIVVVTPEAGTSATKQLSATLPKAGQAVKSASAN